MRGLTQHRFRNHPESRNRGRLVDSMVALTIRASTVWSQEEDRAFTEKYQAFRLQGSCKDILSTQTVNKFETQFAFSGETVSFLWTAVICQRMQWRFLRLIMTPPILIKTMFPTLSMSDGIRL